MNKEKKLVLVFNHFEQEHLGKDVFLVPYYLGKQLNMEVSIVYPLTETNGDFENIYRGVRLYPLKCFRRRCFFRYSALWWLMIHARHINVLMQFHFSANTLLFGNLFKFLHTAGKLYVKSDGVYWLDSVLAIQKEGSLRYYLYKRLLTKIDCVSIELVKGYEQLLNNTYCGVSLKNKAVLVPNGFDEELKSSLRIKERGYIEKENLMITVARIGDKNKNTKMFLGALDNMDLKDWKVLFIGSIMPNFEKEIEIFYERNPEKRRSVFFTGSVYDKKRLWEYYNKSKVFVLTSYSEGFPIVFSEAQRFNNYIITTDISSSYDFVDDNSKGVILKKNDIKGLSSILTNIVNGNIDVSHVDVSPLIWSNLVTRIEL